MTFKWTSGNKRVTCLCGILLNIGSKYGVLYGFISLLTHRLFKMTHCMTSQHSFLETFLLFSQFFTTAITAQKVKFSIKYFFSKCNQILRKLWIWYLLKKFLMENFIFLQCIHRSVLKMSYRSNDKTQRN